MQQVYFVVLKNDKNNIFKYIKKYYTAKRPSFLELTSKIFNAFAKAPTSSFKEKMIAVLLWESFPSRM